MSRIVANRIHLEYEVLGPKDGDAVLLIMGLGRQLTAWPEALCTGLAERGLRVIRFDNRDVGLSWRSPERVDLMRFMAMHAGGARPRPPYTLEDMAADAVGLLDGLGVARAHLVGVSMGGMIGQLMAADHAERVLSLTSIMSSSGNPRLPLARPEVNAVLFAPPPNPFDQEAVAATASRLWGVIGSPAYPTDDALIRARAVADARRGWNPAGVGRQLAAVVANGDRRPKLRRISAPTVVLHGTDDPLVPVQAGRDTAANISGAEMIEIRGMGHDLPEALVPQMEAAILRAVERGRAQAPSR